MVASIHGGQYSSSEKVLDYKIHLWFLFSILVIHSDKGYAKRLITLIPE